MLRVRRLVLAGASLMRRFSLIFNFQAEKKSDWRVEDNEREASDSRDSRIGVSAFVRCRTSLCQMYALRTECGRLVDHERSRTSKHGVYSSPRGPQATRSLHSPRQKMTPFPFPT